MYTIFAFAHIRIMRKENQFEFMKNLDERETFTKKFNKKEEKNENF